jgi:hypothetical protein
MIYDAIPVIMFTWAKCQEVRMSEEGNMSRCMKGKRNNLLYGNIVRKSMMCEVQTFQMNVTGRYGNDAMLRQISESVKMNKIKKGELMNSKTEWNYFKIPRVVIE